MSRFVGGVIFKPESPQKVLQLSRRDVGKRWAILLNDKVIAAQMIVSAFSEKVVIEDQFTEDEAKKFPRGLVGEL